jgi:crossover junction endodeoxyribonuclease RuvC
MSGAVAVLDANTLDLIDGYSIPSAEHRVLVPDLLDLLCQLGPLAVSQVVIEQVASMPGQGVSTTFTFGRAYGTLEGVMQSFRWPVAHITPAVWKRKLSLPKGDKDGARQWARNRWPESGLFSTKLRGQAIGDAAGLAVAWWEMHR